MQKKLRWDFFPNFGFPRLNDQARQILVMRIYFFDDADFLQGAKKNNEDQLSDGYPLTKQVRSQIHHDVFTASSYSSVGAVTTSSEFSPPRVCVRIRHQKLGSHRNVRK